MKSRGLIILLVVGGLRVCATSAEPAPGGLKVWALTETRHVLRTERPGETRQVVLAAARNEWESFQILVRSEEPATILGIEAGELRGPKGSVLGVSEARLFRQHQLYLDTGTYRNTQFKPDWYPDPLIPFDAPAGAKGGLRAVPFELPAGQTHGFWADVHVPSGLAPGEYAGVWRVRASGGRSIEIPVRLTVWEVQLPARSALQTSFGSPAERYRSWANEAQNGSKPASVDWVAVEAQSAQLCSDHRLNATPPREMLRPVAQAGGSFAIPQAQVSALRDFVDRYHVNALAVPHPSGEVKDPVVEKEKLFAWLRAFDRAASELNRPGLIFYTYLKDEPNTEEDYRYVQKWGRTIREAKSAVKVMVVEQTWTEPGMGGADRAWGELYGAVDIWCPLFSLHRQETAAPRQALGETVWTYTALCQGEPTPWWHIDYPLLNYRVPAWIAWHYRMRGLLYWGGMAYWKESTDPWTEAPVYTGRGQPQQGKKGIRFNGEGSLVYPARALGFEGIVPTIRLKALRDGIEDYDLLAMVERSGRAAESEPLVSGIGGSFFKWEKDPAKYQQARSRLAAMAAPAGR